LSFSNLEKYKIEKIKIEKILEQKKLIDKGKIFQKLDELEVKIITFFDKNYPSNLKNIFNPPFLIYYR
jgi:DNA protecting protein dprA